VQSAEIFVFVSVDSNHFCYVRGFEVVMQGLVGDVQLTRKFRLGEGQKLFTER